MRIHDIAAYAAVAGLIVLGGCASDSAPAVQPATAPQQTAPAGRDVLAKLQGRWVNADRGYGTVMRGLTITAAGDVRIEAPMERRNMMQFDGVEGGALIFRAIFYNRADVCTPVGDPPQTLNCAFHETRSARPREGSYTLQRQPAN